MAYSWKTQKTETGFEWAITGTTHENGTVILKSGHSATRAKAAGIAKKWVLFFRRGGVA